MTKQDEFINQSHFVTWRNFLQLILSSIELESDTGCIKTKGRRHCCMKTGIVLCGQQNLLKKLKLWKIFAVGKAMFLKEEVDVGFTTVSTGYTKKSNRIRSVTTRNAYFSTY